MKNRKTLSILIILALMICLSTPTIAIEATANRVPGGMYKTEFNGVFQDNTGAYYTEESGTAVYMNRIDVPDGSTAESISAQYDLPKEVREALNRALDNADENDIVTLFIPFPNNNTQLRGTSEGWGSEFTYNYQGTTFILKNYIVTTETETPTEMITETNDPHAEAALIKTLAVLAGSTLLGNVHVALSVGLSLLDAYFSYSTTFPTSGATGDFIEAYLHYTAIEKFTYVSTDSGWMCRAITHYATWAFAQYRYYDFSAADTIPLRFYYNQSFYSPNYYQSSLTAVTSNFLNADDPITVEIGCHTFELSA